MSAGEPGPPDEPSRKELERLDKLLSGGRAKFVAFGAARGLIAAVVFIALQWLHPRNAASQTLYFILGSQMLALAVIACVLWFGVWPQFQKRAAAIRAGASYAAPAGLKDAQILLLVAIALMSLWIASHFFLQGVENAEAASIFLFVAALVTMLWTFVKAFKSCRRCPPTHLRYSELRGAGILALLVLVFFISTTVVLTKVQSITETLKTSVQAPRIGKGR